MSTYVSVRPTAQYTVICTDCDIAQPYASYNRALNDCKAHRLFQHPDQISWVN